MVQPAPAKARAIPESPTVKLAKFFPEALPVRIPVRLTRLVGDQLSESTTIEFGTTREALFASKLPLEFADRLRLQNSDGTLNVEACVVAVQYNTGKTAVAARFVEDIPNWIIKP